MSTLSSESLWSVMNVAFLIGGISMMMHACLGAFVHRRLADEPELRQELFCPPNAWLGTPEAAGMLRVKYFSPFVKMPETVSELVTPVRWSLTLTRIFGLLFMIAMPLFLLAAAATVIVA
jgi:hypothetical protein